MMLGIDIHRVENLILPMEITPERVTTEDINITTEINTAQMAIQEQQEPANDVSTHGYNLKKQPTRKSARVKGTNKRSHRSGRLYNNPLKTTCAHDTNAHECQTWTSKIWGKGNCSLLKY